MSGLSAEALAQLEDLDLQEARDGLNFVSAAGVREPLGADLSAEELSGLRSWDLSGVMTRLNSLTFEPPPAPIPEPDAGDVEIPDWLQPRDLGWTDEAPGAVTHAADEVELPDWLNPAEEVVPPAGAESPAPANDEQSQWNRLSDNQRNADLGGWYRKLQAGKPVEDWQRQALKDYNVWGSDSPPSPAEAGEAAAEPEEEAASLEAVAAGEAEIKKMLAKWLKKIDFRKLAMEGARYLIPPLTGLILGRLLPPEQAINLTQTAFAVGMLGFIGSGGCAVLERVASGHPRTAGIARLLAAGKVAGVMLAETSMLMAAGSFVGGLWHEGEIVRQAAAQMGQPETGAEWELSPRSDWVEEARAQGWPSAEQRFHAGGGAEELRAQGWQQLGGQPPGEQPGPPKLTPEQTDFLNRVGHTELTEAQERLAAEQAAAEAAQRAAEARQAVLDAATRVVEVQPGDTLTEIVTRAGGDPYGEDFTNTVLQSADVLTGPQNPNRDVASALIDFIKVHPGGVNWRDAINGVGDLAKETVGGVPLKDAIATATRMIYPGQIMKVVVGAAMP